MTILFRIYEILELKEIVKICILFNYRDGQVAQLVEQRPEKPCVAGSIPALSTLYFSPELIGAFLFLIIGYAKSPISRVLGSPVHQTPT